MMEIFSVGVRLTLTNGISAGLLSISRDLLKTQGDVDGLHGKLKAIAGLTLAGGAAMAAGFAGLHLLEKTYDPAKDYARQIGLMSTLGMTGVQTANAVRDAWKSSMEVPTATAAQNIEAFRELRSAFGSTDKLQGEAGAMLPIVQRLSAVMHSLTGKEQEKVGFDMVKAIELRTGVMTPEALKRNAELMSRTLIAMGGTLSVSDYHSSLKMSKLAGMKLDDDFTYNYLPTLMQELKTAGGGGAQTAGTMLMSLYQQMHGRMTKAAMPLWVQSGLVNQSDIVKNATGQYEMKPGSVHGTATFERNPYEWVQQFLRPAVDHLAKIRNISAETAINSMFSNRNAAFAAYNMYAKSQQYERDKATIGKADNSEQAYNKLMATDPELAQGALDAQWKNLLGQLGFSIMPPLISGMRSLIGVLSGLSLWAHEHQGTVRLLVGAFAGLSVLGIVAGGVALLGGAILGLQIAALFVGPALAGLSGMLGLAFGGLGAVFSGLATGALSLFTGAIGALSLPIVAAVAAGALLVGAIWSIVKGWDANKSVFANIRDGIANFFGGLWRIISGFLSHLPVIGALFNSAQPKLPPGTQPSLGAGTPSVAQVKTKADAKKAQDHYARGAPGNFDIGKAWKDVTSVNWFGPDKKPGDPGYVAPPKAVQTPAATTQSATQVPRVVPTSAMVAPAAPTLFQRASYVPSAEPRTAGVAQGGGASPYVSPSTRGQSQQPIVIMMDGSEVGRLVTERQSNDLWRADRGGTGFDGAMNLQPVGTSDA